MNKFKVSLFSSFKKTGKSSLALFVLLFVIAFTRHALLIFTSDYANGWDSYFYLVQLQSLEQTGTMHSTDLSLIYPYFRFINLFFNDLEFSFRLGSVFLAGIFSILIYLVAYRMSSNKLTAFSAYSLSIFSPILSYMAAQFPKNMLGLIFFLLFIFMLHKNKFTFDSKSSIFLFILLIINFLAHRSTAILSVFYFIIYLISRKHKKVLFYLIIGIIPILITVHFIPGLLSLFDFQRFSGQFSSDLNFPALSFIRLWGAGKINIFWLIDIFVGQLMLIFALFKALKKPQTLSIVFVTIMLNFPFFHWSSEGIAFRLFLIFSALSPLLISHFSFANIKMLTPIYFSFIFFSFFPSNGYSSVLHDPPYATYEQMSKKIKKIAPKNTELIITHNALAEYITYKNHIDAMPWLPEYDIDSTKLFRIAYIRFEQNFRFYAKKEQALLKKLAPNYYWLPEFLWKDIVKKAQKENDIETLKEYSGFMNPNKIRPYYLLKNKGDI